MQREEKSGTHVPLDDLVVVAGVGAAEDPNP